MYYLKSTQNNFYSWSSVTLAMTCLSCSTELLTDLVSAHDLFVMQVEMDVYTLCKRVSGIVLANSLAP